MSLLLTAYEGPDGFWMVNNRLAESFLTLVLERMDVSASVRDVLESALLVDNIPLAKLPFELGLELVAVLRRAVSAVVSGEWVIGESRDGQLVNVGLIQELIPVLDGYELRRDN